MLELIIEVALKGAEVLPSLVKDVAGTIAKVEADTVLANRVRDALSGLSEVLSDVLKVL